jgi:hypothetical protein
MWKIIESLENLDVDLVVAKARALFRRALPEELEDLHVDGTQALLTRYQAKVDTRMSDPVAAIGAVVAGQLRPKVSMRLKGSCILWAGFQLDVDTDGPQSMCATRDALKFCSKIFTYTGKLGGV